MRTWLISASVALILSVTAITPARAGSFAVSIDEAATAAVVSCSISLNYPHISTGSPGKVDAKGQFSCTSSVQAFITTKLTAKKTSGTVVTAATSGETRAASTTLRTYYAPKSGQTPPASSLGLSIRLT